MNQSESASGFRQDGRTARGHAQSSSCHSNPAPNHSQRPSSDKSPHTNCPAIEIGMACLTLEASLSGGADGRSARPHHRRRNGSSGTNGRGGDPTRLGQPAGATPLVAALSLWPVSDSPSTALSVVREDDRFGTTSRTRPSESPVPTRPASDNASASDPLQRTVTRDLQPSTPT